MSLLNDMLRDLSHQQKVVDPLVSSQPESDLQAQEQREFFHNSGAVKTLPRTWIPSLVVFVLVFVVLALWRFGFFSQQNASVSSLEPAIESTVQDQSINQKPAELNTVQNSEPSTGQREVLNAKEQSISESPSVDQLPVEPELGTRIAALESAITNLSTVIANANIPSINESIAAASAVENTSQDIEFDEQESVLADADFSSSEQSASVSIQEPFPQVEQEPAVVHSNKADTRQGEVQLSISPNTKWQDQQQAQQAQLLIAQGQDDVATVKLQDFIARATEPRESVKALLDIYAAQEKTDAMQALMAQANYLSDVERSFYAAKIAIIQQQDTQAIQLLEAHLDKAEQHEHYRALLAGLYQRTGMHVEAATHYRRLLATFGDKPAYWLGFALAQDALDQAQVAAQAYMRVNQYADLQPQVRTYVQQRIAALQQ